MKMPEGKIRTRHGEISLEDLAEVQPGMARLMDELARRVQYTYYAAKGGNWDLARHELKQAIGINNIAGKLRPKYDEDLKEFNTRFFAPVGEAIEKKDWKRFEALFSEAVGASDTYHEKYGYGYIRYLLPRTPPEHLELGPVDKTRKRA